MRYMIKSVPTYWNLIKLRTSHWLFSDSLSWQLHTEVMNQVSARVGAQLNDFYESQTDLVRAYYTGSFNVGHNITINNVFLDFTTNRSQGHRCIAICIFWGVGYPLGSSAHAVFPVFDYDYNYNISMNLIEHWMKHLEPLALSNVIGVIPRTVRNGQ